MFNVKLIAPWVTEDQSNFAFAKVDVRVVNIHSALDSFVLVVGQIVIDAMVLTRARNDWIVWADFSMNQIRRPRKVRLIFTL